MELCTPFGYKNQNMEISMSVGAPSTQHAKFKLIFLSIFYVQIFSAFAMSFACDLLFGYETTKNFTFLLKG